MQTLFIYPNTRKEGARAVLPQVCDRLRREGVRLMLPLQFRTTTSGIEDVDYIETGDAVRLADLAVVLGGDGTMLRLARAAAQQELPMLGINVGHVGFRTELEPVELNQTDKLFERASKLESRLMLAVAVERHGRGV